MGVKIFKMTKTSEIMLKKLYTLTVATLVYKAHWKLVSYGIFAIWGCSLFLRNLLSNERSFQI